MRKHLGITGKVQNVFYRAWFAEQAEALGLDGWVRDDSSNEPLEGFHKRATVRGCRLFLVLPRQGEVAA